MENSNIDIELFDIVNKHSDEVAIEKDQRIVEKNIALSVRAARESLRREEIAKEAAIRGKEITKERRKKVSLILVGMAAAIALSTPLINKAVHNAEQTINSINRQIDVGNALKSEQDIAIAKLQYYGLVTKDVNGYKFSEYNTSVGYQKLEISSPEEVYLYKTILSDSEFNKLIGSISYNTETGETKYYGSFEEYLKNNNFSGEKEFEKEMEEIYLQKLQENNGGKAR